MIDEQEFLAQRDFAEQCRLKAGRAKILGVFVSRADGDQETFDGFGTESVRYAQENAIEHFDIGWELNGSQRLFAVPIEYFTDEDPRKLQQEINNLLRDEVATLFWRERYIDYALPARPAD